VETGVTAAVAPPTRVRQLGEANHRAAILAVGISHARGG
jgi:hypothetical protein